MKIELRYQLFFSWADDKDDAREKSVEIQNKKKSESIYCLPLYSWATNRYERKLNKYGNEKS